jgi:uncharacterized membrane protein
MMMGSYLLLLALVGGIAYALGWRPQFLQTGPDHTGDTAVQILKARYASGEITSEEFEQMRRDLEG